MITALTADKIIQLEPLNLVVIPVIEGEDFATSRHDSLHGHLSSYITSGHFEAKLGNTLSVVRHSETTGVTEYLMVGVGETYDLPSESVMTIVNAYLAVAASDKITEVAVDLSRICGCSARHRTKLYRRFAQYTEAGLYNYTETKSGDAPAETNVVFKVAQGEDVTAFDKGVAIGSAMNTAKFLGDLPSNICTPTYLAEYANTIWNVNVKVLNETKIKKLGMGALYSVSKGSDEEGKVIIMEYNNAPVGTKPTVLVGKAVTFDSGGISIKPSAKMDEMKYDMCGGATVYGVMQAAAELELPVNLVGIVGAVENMPSARATKPGDVVTSLSGKTIEIGNTDAEGRLVLCDLLTYAGEKYDPAVVIDMATLTGACCVALGEHATGLFTHDDYLARDLINSGIDTHDRCWRLPIWEDYNKQMDSKFADVSNMGSPGAGASTAACFLGRFAADYDYRWAHLDIAGTAWSTKATGRPVSMLVDYIAQGFK